MNIVEKPLKFLRESIRTMPREGWLLWGAISVAWLGLFATTALVPGKVGQVMDQVIPIPEPENANADSAYIFNFNNYPHYMNCTPEEKWLMKIDHDDLAFLCKSKLTGDERVVLDDRLTDKQNTAIIFTRDGGVTIFPEMRTYNKPFEFDAESGLCSGKNMEGLIGCVFYQTVVPEYLDLAIKAQ